MGNDSPTSFRHWQKVGTTLSRGAREVDAVLKAEVRRRDERGQMRGKLATRHSLTNADKMLQIVGSNRRQGPRAGLPAGRYARRDLIGVTEETKACLLWPSLPWG